jgi:hypothetical protein
MTEKLKCKIAKWFEFFNFLKGKKIIREFLKKLKVELQMNEML